MHHLRVPVLIPVADELPGEQGTPTSRRQHAFPTPIPPLGHGGPPGGAGTGNRGWSGQPRGTGNGWGGQPGQPGGSGTGTGNGNGWGGQPGQPGGPGHGTGGWGGWGRPPGRPVQRSRSPRGLLWGLGITALVVLLLQAHRINADEIIVFCVLIPSLILHEVSHGAVALAFGDDTAKRAGRLTLNPMRHVDLWGTLIVPAITVIAGFGFFGWAKPVPVDVRRLRSPRNHGLLVSLAGPFTNCVLAAVFGLLFSALFVAGHLFPTVTSLGARIVFYAGLVNVWVAVFNMIPIPPLDGSALLERLLPASWWPGYLRIRPYGLVVIIGALVLFSWIGVYPLATLIGHITTWWAHLLGV